VDTIRGQVHLLQASSGDSPYQWSVVITVGSKVFSTQTDTRGNVESIIPDSLVQQNTLKVAMTPPAGSRYYPLYLEIVAADVKRFMPLIAIPKSWTVEQGTFAGQTVPINIQELLALPGDGHNFVTVLNVDLRGSPYFGRQSQVSWYEVGFPIEYAVDSAGSTTNTGALTAEVARIIWKHLDSMEQVFGRDLFISGKASEITRGIVFRIDSRISFAGLGGVTAKLANPLFGLSGQAFLGTVQIYKAAFLTDVAYNNPQSEYGQSIVQHESIHALGMGHRLCSHPSIMCMDGPNRSYSITPFDVAEIEMATITLRGLPFQLKTTCGLAEAFNGWRVVEKGLAPVYTDPLS
jgi:hypothetical protein